VNTQALESASISLAEFRERSGFAGGGESQKSRKRDVTDGLKTVFWAFSLQARTGLKTAYAMERFFEPAAFGQAASGDRFHRNKWPRYLAGRHEPKAVLDAVEAKYPGANACLTSPLWAALTGRPLTRRELEALVLRLDIGIQALVRRRGTAPRPARFPGMSMDRDLAEAIERRASLDALAATVIMLRIANVESEPAAAFQWGRHLLRLMVMLGPTLQVGGIAQPLLDLIGERVLPLASHDDLQPGFPAGTYLEIVRLYVEALRRIKGEPPFAMTEALRHKLGQRILNRRYGHDYFYAFNPIRADTHTASAAASEQLFAAPDVWLSAWGFNMLSTGGHRDAPPDVVRTGEDLWAMRDRLPSAPNSCRGLSAD